MVSFQAEILKFGSMGEKTGSVYVEIPQTIAHQLKPDNKKSFRVKGTLDLIQIKGLALLPMGEGSFILALKSDLRKKLKKDAGKTLELNLEEDLEERKLDPDFETCLQNDESANDFFITLTLGHRMYFNNWISEAKTMETKEIRIIACLKGLANHFDFGQIIRSGKKQKEG